MKVLYLFLTTESAEAQAVQSFKDGYNSAGADWDSDPNNEITVRENITNIDINEAFLQPYIDDGYELVIRNTSPSFSGRHIYAFGKDNGMLFCLPVGSNSFVDVESVSGLRSYEKRFSLVTCGAGLPSIGNATGYPGMFFDCATVELAGNPIVDIRQCGTTYKIVKIQRRNSGTIVIKVTDMNDVPITDVSTIGLFMHGSPAHCGVPLTFSAVTGSDILPLPDVSDAQSGVHAVSFAGGDFIFVTHTTTSGTIDTGFLDSDFQDCTGTIAFGDASTSKVLVQMQNFGVALQDSGVTFDSVGGFDNLPNGRQTIAEYVNLSGFGNIVKIVHSLGAGSYTGSGTMIFATQSYSTPFIAGKLSNIKAGGLWDDAIGKALLTGSEDGIFDNINGYGVIDIAAAQVSRDTALTTPVLTLSTGAPGAVGLEWTLDPFADHYDIEFRGVIIDTVTAQITVWGIGLQRQSRNKRNSFRVRSKRGALVSEWSNIVEYPYYYSEKIIYKVGAGYGLGFGTDYGGSYGM